MEYDFDRCNDSIEVNKMLFENLENKYNTGMTYEGMLGHAENNGWNHDAQVLRSAIDAWYRVENA